MATAVPAIEWSLAGAQLRTAILVGLLTVAISVIWGMATVTDVAVGVAIVVLTLAITWPIHLIATRGGRQAIFVEMALIPVRFLFLVALAILALNNIARSGIPFALGIALPLIGGVAAAVWASARDPRYYWVDPHPTHVPRTNQTP